jgi:polysaccharide biosynthesis protein PslH
MISNEKTRPRILFVTSHWPLAQDYGAQQRVLNIGKLLSRLGDVSFLIVSTEAADPETVRKTQNEFRVCGVMRPLVAEPRGLFDRLPERILHEFDPTYLETDPYFVGNSDRLRLEELVNEHDLVWVHTIRTANWFRTYRWPHSVLDVDDLPSRIEQSSARSGGNPVQRLLNLRRAWFWRRRERMFLERFDVLTVCSQEDRLYLGESERIHVVPNGSYSFAKRSHVVSDAPRIGFIGNCEFKPNEDGLKWFIREAWPHVKRRFPLAQLRLVGRESARHLPALGPDVVGLGWLQDPGDEMATWSAMIVPIRFGGGTRVKLAEGFARRCPVVATTIGAFGYGAQNGKEILVSDSARGFAANCVRLLTDVALGETLADRAHKLLLERWTWDSFEGSVRSAVEDCLTRNKQAQAKNLTADVPVPKHFQVTRS